MHRINRLTIVKLASDSCGVFLGGRQVGKRNNDSVHVFLGAKELNGAPTQKNNNCQTISFVPNGE